MIKIIRKEDFVPGNYMVKIKKYYSFFVESKMTIIRLAEWLCFGTKLQKFKQRELPSCFYGHW